MADQVDGRMGNGRWPNRKRNTPSRFAPPAANPDDVSEPHEKRQKISSTDYVSKAAEQPGPTTPNDEPVTPPVKDAANKRHRTPKPNLPLTPQSSPAETLQAGGSISEGIEKYFVAGKPDGDAAQVGTSAPSSHPEPDLENNVSAGKKKQAGKKTANTGGKKSGISKKPDTRPLPSGEPPVWALGRQALCEALPYYRANHSAAYCHDGLCDGFLLDGGGGLRSYMDSEIIITRAGGGAKTGEDGATEQVESQDADNATVRAIINNMEEQFPIALIVGEKNDASPVQLPHRYCVLGWFVVTKVWAEKELNPKNEGQSVTVYKYRFEKLDLNERSWWIPKGSEETSPMNANPVAAPTRQCTGECGKFHTQIYEEGWTCLSPGCNEFHSIVTSSNNNKLTYSKVFLSERRSVTHIILPRFKLVPTHLSDEDAGEDASYSYARGAWKGFVCPKCRVCNQRRFWDRLECLLDSCDYVNFSRMPVLNRLNLLPDHGTEVEGHAAPNPPCKDSVTKSKEHFGGWVITTYKFTDNDYVTHFQANKYINAAGNSSNELLIDLQRDSNLKLQRYPRDQSGDVGFLTNNYTRNFGLPYKYIVQVEGSGFSEAPNPVIHALHRLIWAGRRAVTSGECKAFNEILTVGYMDKGEMKYHDDGEKDLGPTVASLSLGASATMTFRMKSKYYTGLTKTGGYDPKAPIPDGAWCKKQREEFNAKFSDLKANSPALKKEVAAFYKTLGKKPGECPALVTLKLAHGDMTVQHGCGLQKHFEHQVTNDGKFRIAMTARHIDPDCETAQGKQDLGDYNAADFSDYNGSG